MWAVVTQSTANGVDWLNTVYLLTAVVIAAGVIVGSIRKLIKRAMEEVIDDRIKPHLLQYDQRFDALSTQLAELRGERRGKP